MKPRQLAQEIANRAAARAQKQAHQRYSDSVEYLEQETKDTITSRTAFPANSPDDIVYSGNLLRSQRTIQSKNATLIQWNTKSKKGYKYAPKVVTGFKAWGKGRMITGRDWATLALQKTQQAGGNLIGKTILDPERGVVLKVKIKKLKVKTKVTIT